MPLELYLKENQVINEFGEGEIEENKPIAFPQDKGQLKPYSNIFYWANLVSEEGGQIPIHGHQGFEIITFVVKGVLEQFDTLTKEWNKLLSGDVQLMKPGKGMQHTERYGRGTQVIQIWFNPDLRKTMVKPPAVFNYSTDDMPEIESDKKKIVTLIGSGSPVEMDTYGTRLKEITFFTGNHLLALEMNAYYSIYCIKGSIEINNKSMVDDDFMIINEEFQIDITAAVDTKLLILETPIDLNYLTYYQMYPQKYQ